jgi:Domain of unknown function (DUF4274)
MEKAQQKLADWLRDQSTDVFHAAVLNYNWDYGIEFLEWAVLQPQADKATGAEVLWRTDPAAVVGCVDDTDFMTWDEMVADTDGNCFKLNNSIIDRWSTKEFQDTGIKFMPSDQQQHYWNFVKSLKRQDRLPWQIPQEIGQPFGFREVPNVYELMSENLDAEFEITIMFDRLGSYNPTMGPEKLAAYVTWCDERKLTEDSCIADYSKVFALQQQ